MKSDELAMLEQKVKTLEERHEHLESDIVLLKEIFKHIKDRFDLLKMDMDKKK